MPNIGILYLAGMLQRSGTAVATFDLQATSSTPAAAAAKIAQLRPGLVGFTVYDATLASTKDTIACLRRDYDGPIVLGGYTATFHAEELLLAWPQADFVIVREGEVALVALVDHLNGVRALGDVPNLVYRDACGVVRNRECPLVSVTELPWPKREWPEEGSVTPIITRRGCYSRCSFCSMVPFYDRALGAVVRSRSVGDVVDELEYCQSNGATQFMIYDDDFGLSTEHDRTWCSAFLKELGRRRLSVKWAIETRVADVIKGKALLPEMCAAGVNHISVGMESMLPRQLKLYNKGYRQAEIYQAIEILDELPVDYQTNVIFWDPWCTMTEAEEHLRLLESIRLYDQLGAANIPIYHNRLTPRRGTAFYSELEKRGMLRQTPGSIADYWYDFIDPDVTAFRRGPWQEFARRTARRPRPPALWLNIPKLDAAGDHGLARCLRTYASAVSRAEFQYFKALVSTYVSVSEGAGRSDALAEVHTEFSAQVDACFELLPRRPVTPRVCAL